MADRLVLVEPYAEKRSGKLLQLKLAKRYFTVPDYTISLNHALDLGPKVVKSLSNAAVGDGVFFTTRVDTRNLSIKYPWFIESEVSAEADVTVVFVRGRLFSYSLSRTFQDAFVDWRQIDTPMQDWRLLEIPDDLKFAIQQYMQVLRLDYGRLDFLLDDAGRYWFCEVNPNGQFAWLDLKDEHGLLSAVVEEITVEIPVKIISNPHPLSRYLDRPSS